MAEGLCHAHFISQQIRNIIYLEALFFIVKSEKTAVTSQECLKLLCQDWPDKCYQGVVNENK